MLTNVLKRNLIINLIKYRLRNFCSIENSKLINNKSDEKVNENIEFCDYLDSNNKNAFQMIKKSMKVIENFVNESEENSLINEIEPYMSGLKYETSHWDHAIHDYRETERLKWNQNNEIIINRVRQLAFPKGVSQIKFVHILDLAQNGVIKPHIDSIRFCGDTIAGISLLSASVMRLVDENDNNMSVDVLLKRRSLYIMTGEARYRFTHEILSQENSKFKGNYVKKDRRISIICRNEPIL